MVCGMESKNGKKGVRNRAGPGPFWGLYKHRKVRITTDGNYDLVFSGKAARMVKEIQRYEGSYN